MKFFSWFHACWHDIVLKHHITHVDEPAYPGPDGFLVGHCTCGGVVIVRQRDTDWTDGNTWAINVTKVTCPGIRDRIRRIAAERDRHFPAARIP